METIMMAGVNNSEISRLSYFLAGRGYVSVLCKTVKDIIKELRTLQVCGIRVSLVMIEPAILEAINNNLVSGLSKYVLDVPFILIDVAEIPNDLMEIFEKICVHRKKLRIGENRLANILREVGIELACS